jgi:hypothetical protein
MASDSAPESDRAPAATFSAGIVARLGLGLALSARRYDRQRPLEVLVPSS